MTKCKICKEPFTKWSMTHKCCSPTCAMEWVKLDGLLAKIGPVAVERLELDHSIKKWTIDDAKAIKAHYRARLVELVNGEAA